jgi:mRNA-degrading endonuclease toxin of MazEF toxin-antitoxin module
VNLDDIQTMPMAWLDRRITTLSPEKMAEVAGAIRFALDLD